MPVSINSGIAETAVLRIGNLSKVVFDNVLGALLLIVGGMLRGNVILKEVPKGSTYLFKEAIYTYLGLELLCGSGRAAT